MKGVNLEITIKRVEGKGKKIHEGVKCTKEELQVEFIERGEEINKRVGVR